MKESPSKHKKPAIKKDLFLLFAAPIVVIAFAIALVYVPRLFANPSYDFIYSSCTGYSYDCERRYTVRDGRIILNVDTDRYRSSSDLAEATLYYFDSAANTSRRIDYTQALGYILIASKTSPDNYKLQREGSGSILFWGGGSSDSPWYLADGLKKKQLNLPTGYDTPVSFIGWVEK